MYRERTSSESRAHMARAMTQTAEGRCVHSREPRRQAFPVTTFDAPLFVDKKATREPKIMKTEDY